eukprot:TRINITY_DN6412_c0_g1_i1.p1 TRINITY_DN6412_c0_g1~~TRINITY_DN6412_c0_g1_i1.p1  ORF type:complete len:695 (+),score=132.71 TRINITY_DN6412_c0_g1_i1:43-2085(+)
MTAAALLFGAFAMSAVKDGLEFLVNTHLDGPQQQPACAKLSNGGFVITWESMGQDSSRWGVFGQSFDHLSVEDGPEFAVNTHTKGSQKDPDVAGLQGANANEFVVTWASKLQDGTDFGIRAQRFDLNGNMIGDEFSVNTFHDGRQRQPSISSFSDGGYVIAWDSFGQDSSEYGVYAQIFDASHNMVGNEIAVNTHTDLDQREPAVVVLCNGGFVVTWTSWLQDGSKAGVYYQVFDSVGTKVGAERQVHTTTDGSQSEPSITAFDCGGFIITWQGKSTTGTRKEIHAQVFNENGNQWGDERIINTNIDGQQKFPAVRTLANGHYVIAWETDIDGHTDIHAQEYDLYGNKFGDEFKVNSHLEDSQSWPAVCSWDHRYGFIVAWTSQVLGTQEGIHAQKFLSEKTDAPATGVPITPAPLEIWIRGDLDDSHNYNPWRFFENQQHSSTAGEEGPGTSLYYSVASLYGYPEYKAIFNDIRYLFWNRAHLLLWGLSHQAVDPRIHPQLQGHAYWNLRTPLYLFFYQWYDKWPEDFWPLDKPDHLPELVRGTEYFDAKLQASGYPLYERLSGSMNAADFGVFSTEMEWCSEVTHELMGGDLAGTKYRGTDVYHYLIQGDIDRHFSAYVEKVGADTIEQFMIDNYPTEFDSDLMGFEHPVFGVLTPRKVLRSEDVGYKYDTLEILPYP